MIVSLVCITFEKRKMSVLKQPEKCSKRVDVSIRFIRFHKRGFYEASTYKNICLYKNIPLARFLFISIHFISIRFHYKIHALLFEKKRKLLILNNTCNNVTWKLWKFCIFIIILLQEYVQRILSKNSYIIIKQ